MEDHYRSLENMYRSAPVNQIFLHRVSISHKTASIHWEVKPEFFHAAGSLHGAAYFKMLDDAAFFASASVESEFFVLTTSFHLHFMRRVTGGNLVVEGRVIQETKNLLVAESILTDEKGREVARGIGDFMRSSTPLSSVPSYGLGLR